MARYIELDTLLAEIERRLEEYRTYPDYQIDSNYMELCEILSFINTLEVKEVDLDSERRKYLTEHFNVYEDGILQSKRSNLPLDTYDVIKLAKHFYSLGLKAQKG